MCRHVVIRAGRLGENQSQELLSAAPFFSSFPALVCEFQDAWAEARREKATKVRGKSTIMTWRAVPVGEKESQSQKVGKRPEPLSAPLLRATCFKQRSGGRAQVMLNEKHSRLMSCLCW